MDAIRVGLARSSMSLENSFGSSLPRNVLDSLTLRAMLIGLLALLMLVPLGFVSDIVYERSARYQSVLDDIASTWGLQQTLVAPVLVVPFTEVFPNQESVTDEHGKTRIIDKTIRRTSSAYFLPVELGMEINIRDESRRRGIFESLVYSADISITAAFDELDIQALSDHIDEVHWNKAWLAIGLSDTRAITGVSGFSWDGASQTLSPGTGLDVIPSGFHAALSDFAPAKSHSLQVTMGVKGSNSMSFAPLGELTSVKMNSTWPHPSFQGNALPDEYTIADTGFSAVWTVPHLARNYPQSWNSAEQEIDLLEFTAGVSMFEPVSLYTQVIRAVKYGILFIGLTFLTLLIFEVSISNKIHIVQYILIGIALSLFFLMLLSLSEHLAFITAYVFSAGLTITIISVYTWAVLRSTSRALAVLALLSSLYAVLFSLLKMEDFALLAGTALLVIVVIVLMIVTRDIQHRGFD